MAERGPAERPSSRCRRRGAPRASACSTRGRSARASGAKSTTTWPPSPRRRSCRGSSRRRREVRLERRGGREVAAGVDVDRDQRPRRLDRHRGRAERHQRSPERIDLLPDAGVERAPPAPRARRSSGLAPVAERLRRRARRRAEQAGGARRGASASQSARRAAISAATSASSASRRRRAQDQPEVVGSRPPAPPSRERRRAPRAARDRAGRGRRSRPARPASGSPARPFSSSRALTGGALPASAQPETCTSTGRPGARQLRPAQEARCGRRRGRR